MATTAMPCSAPASAVSWNLSHEGADAAAVAERVAPVAEVGHLRTDHRTGADASQAGHRAASTLKTSTA